MNTYVAICRQIVYVRASASRDASGQVLVTSEVSPHNLARGCIYTPHMCELPLSPTIGRSFLTPTMPTTRAQDAAEKRTLRSAKPASKATVPNAAKPASKGKPVSSKKPTSVRKPASKKAAKKEHDDSAVHVGQKREAEAEEEIVEKPRAKKAKTEESNEKTATKQHSLENAYQTGGSPAVHAPIDRVLDIGRSICPS